jgi:hypothetical protein
MSWAHVQGTSVQSSGNVQNLSASLSGVTGGDVLASGYAGYPSGPYAVTPSDSQSNIWSADTSNTFGGVGQVAAFVGHSVTTTGGTVTVTWGAPGGGDTTYCAMTVDEFSESGTVTVDSEVSSSGSSSTSSPSVGSLSVSGTDLIYATLGFDSAATVTAGSGYTLTGYLNYTGGTVGIASEYLLNATSSTNPSWSLGTAATCYQAGVAYKTASGTVTGSGAITLGAISASGAATFLDDASGAITLGSIATTGEGTFTASASGAVTLGAISASGSGTFTASASGSITLGTIETSGTGKFLASSSGSITLGAISASGSAFSGCTAAGAVALGSLEASGTGTFLATATGDVTLGSIDAAGSGGNAGRSVLQASDFTYLGYYTLNNASTGLDVYDGTGGMAIRYVGDSLRFIVPARNGDNVDLVEYMLPTGGYGGSVTGAQRTNYWAASDVWNYDFTTDWVDGSDGAVYSFTGLWWEDQGGGNGRLWSAMGINYPADNTQFGYTQSICVRDLDTTGSGTVTNFRGLFGLEGITQRAIYGGVAAIPAWFRSAYGITQPYCIGWGGNAARAGSAISPVSMGLSVYAVPDLTTLPNPTNAIASDLWITMADHSSGWSPGLGDWYADYTGPGYIPPFDRGFRNPNVDNQFDAPNGTNTLPQYWASPAPDGHGRFIWCDSFYGCGTWIEMSNKYGFVTVLNGGTGFCYYYVSNCYTGPRCAEIQVFDPADFGAVIQGSKNSWNVQPVAELVVTDDLVNIGPGMEQDNPTGTGAEPAPAGGPAGSAFDPTTNILWLYIGGYGLAAYQVNNSGGNTAYGAITLGSIETAGAGTASNEASGAIVLGALEVAGVATGGCEALGSITLGALEAVGVGVTPAFGSGDITLGSIAVVGLATGSTPFTTDVAPQLAELLPDDSVISEVAPQKAAILY